MTVEVISGSPNEIKGAFVITSAVAEAGAISTIVTAGEVALVIESTVDLRSINIDVMVQRLADGLKEGLLKSL